jgi:hypothetical protein
VPLCLVGRPNGRNLTGYVDLASSIYEIQDIFSKYLPKAKALIDARAGMIPDRIGGGRRKPEAGRRKPEAISDYPPNETDVARPGRSLEHSPITVADLLYE